MKRKRKRLTKAQREKVWELTHHHCAYCGRSISYDEMQVDHYVALSRGGADELSNMLPACRACNYYKDTKQVESFRKELSKLLYRMERDSFVYRLAKAYGLVISNPHKAKFYFEKLGLKVGKK